MAILKQFHDRKLSIWQSAVDEAIALKRNASGKPMGPSAPDGHEPIERPDTSHPAVQESAAYCAAVNKGQPIPEAPAAPTLAIPLASTLGYCSLTALRLAKAIILHNAQDEQQYRDALCKFSDCDPCYIQAAEKYAEYFLAQCKKIPYRVYAKLSDFVFNDKLPARGRVAILGDWGTGQTAASKVLGQLAAQKPDLVIHLGDVYYAGTQFEDENYFYAPWSQILDLAHRSIPTFTLSGNHDMYCGGVPYYQLIDKLGQPASYFCLRNDHWQFLAMDTGLHDSNPVQDGQAATYLEDTELVWHKDKVDTAAGRKTVLLSHHPLFTAYDAIEGHDVNLRFYPQVFTFLSEIALWLWGHEHNFVVYGSYQGVQRARCIGHAAFPVGSDEIPAKPKFPDVPVIKKDSNGKDITLGQTLGLYNHGFAIIELDGPSATISYFQDGDPATPLFQEAIA
jgi:hypothetical protein